MGLALSELQRQVVEERRTAQRQLDAMERRLQARPWRPWRHGKSGVSPGKMGIFRGCSCVFWEEHDDVTRKKGGLKHLDSGKVLVFDVFLQ